MFVLAANWCCVLSVQFLLAIISLHCAALYVHRVPASVLFCALTP